MHDAITLGVPVLAIFFGILLNQRGLGELRSDLKSDISRVESKIDRMQSDLTQFSRELGRHDARLDSLESKRS
jgi:septal ring factor EnvC (AmiA/AmiB activator)